MTGQRDPQIEAEEAPARLWPELDPPFALEAPRGREAPFLVNCPHSGRVYPQRFIASSRLDSLTLRRSEDAYVDELFAGAPQAGAPLLRARFPRAFLDANREPYELDPRMFADRLPGYANTRSNRVAAGLGTIPRLVGEGLEIYAAPLPAAEAAARIGALYVPYHAALKALFEAMRARWGDAVLIDAHSMPSRLLGPKSEMVDADIVIGDRYGASAEADISAFVSDALRARGYRVACNKPYAGGFITEHYGRPHVGAHVVQIEINRALYLDEKRIEKTAGFAPLAADLAALCADLADYLRARRHCRAAAE